MKQDIVFSRALIPQSVIPSECKYISFRCLPSTGTFINRGEDIFVFSFYGDSHTRTNKVLLGEYTLPSPHSGFVYNFHGDYTMQIDERRQPIIATIYSSLQELQSTKFNTTYTIKEDDFTSEKVIKWDKVAGLSGYIIDDSVYLILSIDNKNPVMDIIYDKKKTPIKRNDTITFRFEDNSYLSFPITKNPGKWGDRTLAHFIRIPLTNNDINTFAAKGWDLFRIEHCNGDAPVIRRNQYSTDYCPPFSMLLFKEYVNLYIQALTELHIVPTENFRSLEQNTIVLPDDDVCYVYLMVDTSNGFHKIGISNHPEYRERTLQSEKPTIEKVCAKRFPTRQIASAIESALHTTFASKRVRGEWFNLSEIEVEQIKESLR